MTGLSALFCIALMLICSLALMGLEAFIPGVSFAGIAGIILLAAALYFCWSSFGIPALIAALVIWGIIAFFVMRTVLRSLKHGKISKSGVFLNTESAPTVQQQGTNQSLAVGCQGITTTALRPAGIADFSGTRVHVAAANGFIDKDAVVVITRMEGAYIAVDPVNVDH